MQAVVPCIQGDHAILQHLEVRTRRIACALQAVAQVIAVATALCIRHGQRIARVFACVVHQEIGEVIRKVVESAHASRRHVEQVFGMRRRVGHALCKPRHGLDQHDADAVHPPVAVRGSR